MLLRPGVEPREQSFDTTTDTFRSDIFPQFSEDEKNDTIRSMQRDQHNAPYQTLTPSRTQSPRRTTDPPKWSHHSYESAYVTHALTMGFFVLVFLAAVVIACDGNWIEYNLQLGGTNSHNVLFRQSIFSPTVLTVENIPPPARFCSYNQTTIDGCVVRYEFVKHPINSEFRLCAIDLTPDCKALNPGDLGATARLLIIVISCCSVSALILFCWIFHKRPFYSFWKSSVILRIICVGLTCTWTVIAIRACTSLDTYLSSNISRLTQSAGSASFFSQASFRVRYDLVVLFSILFNLAVIAFSVSVGCKNELDGPLVPYLNEILEHDLIKGLTPPKELDTLHPQDSVLSGSSELTSTFTAGTLTGATSLSRKTTTNSPQLSLDLRLERKSQGSSGTLSIDRVVTPKRSESRPRTPISRNGQASAQFPQDLCPARSDPLVHTVSFFSEELDVVRFAPSGKRTYDGTTLSGGNEHLEMVVLELFIGPNDFSHDTLALAKKIQFGWTLIHVNEEPLADKSYHEKLGVFYNAKLSGMAKLCFRDETVSYDLTFREGVIGNGIGFSAADESGRNAVVAWIDEEIVGKDKVDVGALLERVNGTGVRFFPFERIESILEKADLPVKCSFRFSPRLSRTWFEDHRQ